AACRDRRRHGAPSAAAAERQPLVRRPRAAVDGDRRARAPRRRGPSRAPRRRPLDRRHARHRRQRLALGRGRIEAPRTVSALVSGRLPHPRPLLAALSAALALAAAPAALAAPASTTETAGLDAVNAARIAHGLHAVRVDSHLRSAARAHSSEMLRRDYFAHGDVEARLAAFGVTTSFAGENLAWGTGSMGTAQTIVAEWLASPG